MKIRFITNVKDNTGLGNASKNMALAFNMLSEHKIRYIFSSMTDNIFYSKLKDNIFSGTPDLDFYMHAPPWNYNKTRASKKISYFYWEADTLPDRWIRDINFVDEIWAPCNLVYDACKKAGFRNEIKILNTPHSTRFLANKIKLKNIDYSDKFVFYSIFQWSNRKGYKELLNAYFSEFKSDDNVLLVLKVNELGYNGMTNDKIIPEILSIKQLYKNTAKIYLINELCHDDVIFSMHNSFDCFIQPSHGEGWGIPLHDALNYERNVITTNFGGVAELIPGSYENLLNYSLLPITDEMNWSGLYNQKQKWAYYSVDELKLKMRNVFNSKNRLFKNNIKDITSINFISNKIREIL